MLPAGAEVFHDHLYRRPEPGEPGKPQFMIAADQELVLLRVRAAEWTFPGAATSP